MQIESDDKAPSILSNVLWFHIFTLKLIEKELGFECRTHIFSVGLPAYFYFISSLYNTLTGYNKHGVNKNKLKMVNKTYRNNNISWSKDNNI